ncbi:MAG: hypothetical protein R3Y54_14120, partial [Eubacteriales bacterium]
MKKRANYWITSIMFIGALFLVLGILYANRSHEISDVSELTYNDGMLYGMYQKDKVTYLFEYDVDTSQSSRMKVTNGTINSLTAMGNGQAYAVYTSEGSIYLTSCDFKKGTLETITDMNEIEGEFLTSNPLRNDNLVVIFLYSNEVMEYVTYEYDGIEFRCLDQEEVELGHLTYMYDLDGNLWSIDAMGNIYQNEMVFHNDGSQISKRNTAFEAYDTFHFKNLDDGNTYQLVDGKLEIVEFNYEIYQFEDQQVEDIEFDEKTNITYGILMSADGRKVPIFYDGEKEVIIESAMMSTRELVYTGIFLWIAIFFLGMVCYGIIQFYVHRKLGIPVSVIISVLLLPVSILGYFCAMEKMEGNLLETQALYFSEYASSVGEFYAKQIDMRTFEENYHKEYLSTDDITVYFEHIEVDLVYWESIYFYKNGELYSAEIYNLLNVPLDESINKNAYRMIVESLEKGQQTLIEYRDNGLDVSTMITPLRGLDGTVIGGLEVVFDTYEVKASFEDQITRIRVILILVLMAMYVFTCTICYFITRKLGKIRSTAYEIMKGNFAARTNLKGKNEVSDLGNRMDCMGVELEHKFSYLRKLDETYKTFLSEDQILLLHLEGVLGVNVGDSVTLNKPTMSMNRSFEKEISYIVQHHYGFVQFSQESAKITLFDFEQVVQIAINLQEQQKEGTLYISVVRQTSKMGVIGTTERKFIQMISQDNEFSN